MDNPRLRSEPGFTLVELLVAMAIIAILAAIALPQFDAYRRGSYEAEVKTDLQNAAVAEEAYFVSSSKYKGGALASGTPPGFNNTAGVSVSATVGSSSYVLSATHSNCGATTWTFNSASGQLAGGPC